MLILSRRLNEALLFPGFDTAVRVVELKPNVVRLGIEAPDEVRVLRGEVPDRAAEWGPDPADGEASPSILRINQLLKKRLQIARLGLTEAADHLRAGHEDDADHTLAKLDEDLTMLQRRVQREVERTSLLNPVAEEPVITPLAQLVRKPK
jgi:carbon storage regulator CsrA